MNEPLESTSLQNSNRETESKGRRIKVERGALRELPVRVTPPERRNGEDAASSGKHHLTLSDLYTDSDGKVPSMKTLDQTKRSKQRVIWWLFIGLLLVAGASIAGFVVFGETQDTAAQDSLKLSFEAPPRVTSGEAFDVVLAYTNQEAVDLQNVILTFRFPNGYTLRSSDPEQTSALTWNVGSLASGQTQRVRLRGEVIGETGATIEWQVHASYTPKNFSSMFSQTSSVTSVISDSIIGMQVETPLRIVPNNAFSYQLTLTNNAETPLKNLRIELATPKDLTVESANPAAADPEHNVWSIDSIEPNATAKIAFRGVFTSTEQETREIAATVLLKGDDGFYKKQAEVNSIYFVLNPKLELDLAVNGKDRATIGFGDQPEFTLTYKNPSDVVLLDVALTVEIADPFAMLKLEETDFSPATRTDQTIVWTKDALKELERVEPGETGAVKFSVDTVESLGVNDATTNVEATFSPRATASSVEDIEGYVLTSTGDPVTVAVKTTAAIQAEGRYFDENLQPIGSGPIPPQVGKTTVYQIVWSISNTLNALQDVTVTTTLPDNVTWKGNADATHGDVLVYDPATRTVTWNIASVGIYAGLLRSAPEGTFEVSITPTEEDLGRSVKLTTRTEFSATDKFTDAAIELSDAAIITELENDLGASGKATVVEPES